MTNPDFYPNNSMEGKPSFNGNLAIRNLWRSIPTSISQPAHGEKMTLQKATSGEQVEVNNHEVNQVLLLLHLGGVQHGGMSRGGGPIFFFLQIGSFF